MVIKILSILLKDAVWKKKDYSQNFNVLLGQWSTASNLYAKAKR